MDIFGNSLNNTHIGDVKITENLSVGGDLTVAGTTTISGEIKYEDPLIELASTNTTSNLVNIGFYAPFDSGAGTRYTGLIRNFSTGKWFIFDDRVTEPVPGSGVYTPATTGLLELDSVFLSTLRSLTGQMLLIENDAGVIVAQVEINPTLMFTINPTARLKTPRIRPFVGSTTSFLYDDGKSTGAQFYDLDGTFNMNFTILQDCERGEFNHVDTKSVSLGSNKVSQQLTTDSNAQYIFAIRDVSAQIQRSATSGAIWTAVGTSHIYNSICCSADGRWVYATDSSNNLYSSADFGASWASVGSFPAITVGQVACTASGQVVMCSNFVASGPGFVYSTDFGSTWITTGFVLTYARYCAISADGNRAFLASYNGATSTVFIINNWFRQLQAVTNIPGIFNYNSVAASASLQYIYLTTLANTDATYYSHDYGVTFQASDLKNTSNQARCDSSGKYVYVASGQAGDTDALWVSTNYGVNYTLVAASNLGGFDGITACTTPTSGRYVYYTRDSATSLRSIIGWCSPLKSEVSLGNFTVGGTFSMLANSYGLTSYESTSNSTVEAMNFNTGEKHSVGQIRTDSGLSIGPVSHHFVPGHIGIDGSASAAPGSISYASIQGSLNYNLNAFTNNSIVAGRSRSVSNDISGNLIFNASNNVAAGPDVLMTMEQKARFGALGQFVIGNGIAEIPTNETAWFLYMSTMGGQPVGVPGTSPSSLPVVLDSVSSPGSLMWTRNDHASGSSIWECLAPGGIYAHVSRNTPHTVNSSPAGTLVAVSGAPDNSYIKNGASLTGATGCQVSVGRSGRYFIRADLSLSVAVANQVTVWLFRTNTIPGFVLPQKSIATIALTTVSQVSVSAVHPLANNELIGVAVSAGTAASNITIESYDFTAEFLGT